MSDTKHPIDDLFARNLAGYEVEPPLHLWANIAREQKRRRKPLIWYWLSAGAAVMAGLMALIFFAQTSGPVELSAFAVPVEMAQPAAKHETTAAVEMPVPAEHAVPVAPSVSAPTAAPLPVRTVSDAGRPAIAPISSQPAAITLKAVEPATETQEAETTTVSARLPVSEELPAPGAKLLAYSSPAPEFVQPEIPAGPVQRCARFKSGKPIWFTEFTLAPTIAFRELNPVDPEFASYARGREETESSLFSFSAAGRISVVFPWGLSLRSGVQYTQINERFNYLSTNEQQTIITDIFGPNGQIIRTDTTYINSAHQYTTRNQYHLVDIPVLVGYEFHTDNLTLAISGGPSFNMRLGKKGEFLSPVDQEPISFNENQPNGYRAFKDKVGIGWQGSLGLYYEMNSRLDLLFEPYFRLYPKSFTLDEYPVRQRYFMAGLGVGLRFTL
ncbi:MAG: outer membrane beta-barrel protein [Lewinellaceae bacterium]|nr:outer membrane beta-barrel protein [Lewinella sp.]MCB9280023.1 outer membrane beta-barrel protein [Lewinellaceae bacterium]